MSRLILLIVLGVVAALYFPESRAVLLEKGQPILNPVYRWSTGDEMDQILRDLVIYHEETNQLPSRRNWVDWLEYRYPMEESRQDAWGTTYALQIWGDSIGVISYGPDRERGTDDDVVRTTPRPRARRR